MIELAKHLPWKLRTWVWIPSTHKTADHGGLCLSFQRWWDGTRQDPWAAHLVHRVSSTSVRKLISKWRVEGSRGRYMVSPSDLHTHMHTHVHAFVCKHIHLYINTLNLNTVGRKKNKHYENYFCKPFLCKMERITWFFAFSPQSYTNIRTVSLPSSLPRLSFSLG